MMWETWNAQKRGRVQTFAAFFVGGNIILRRCGIDRRDLHQIRRLRDQSSAAKTISGETGSGGSLRN